MVQRKSDKYIFILKLLKIIEIAYICQIELSILNIIILVKMSIYQLKITLKNIHPDIWRRIIIQSDISLDLMHYIIQDLMPWTDSHLYDFQQDDNHYITEKEHDQGMDCDGLVDEINLSDLLEKEKDKMIYNYDYGDGWEHEIILEKILEAEEGVEYPICTGGQRRCPPDDCGGPWGYQRLLDVLNDPEHGDYEMMREWVGLDEGEVWDPEYFDLQETNDNLPILTEE
jgi:Plasmid pRiA4b ORF-3-like protein